MSDVPPGGYRPPPPSGAYPPPPGAYPPPPPPPGAGSYPPPYQQQGYGWTEARTAPYAGFWIRLLSVVVDGLVLGIPIALLAFALDPDQFNLNAGVGYNPNVDAAINGLNLIAGVLYYSLLEGGAAGQTLGKRLCGIRVVDADTYQPGIGVGRGVGRWAARFLSQIPCGLGYLWMLWDPRKQTWHDKLVRTVVVKG